MTSTIRQPPVEAVVGVLNVWLRRERAAVLAYGRAIEALRGSSYARLLSSCRESHVRRVELLADEIVRRGGQPRHDTGLLGTIVVALLSMAIVWGEQTALRALHTGERLTRQAYARAVRGLGGAPRNLAKHRLLPEQRWTSATMAAVT